MKKLILKYFLQDVVLRLLQGLKNGPNPKDRLSLQPTQRGPAGWPPLLSRGRLNDRARCSIFSSTFGGSQLRYTVDKIYMYT